MPNINVDTASDLTTAFATINSATSPADYTITLASAPISLDSASLDPVAGTTVTFQGSYELFITAFAVVGAVTMDLNFSGTITLDGGSLDNSAITENGGGTIIAGNFSGQILGTPGDGGDTVTNAGTITNAAANGAVDLDTGTINNDSTAALISGTEIGVELDTSGTVLNAGTITATDPSLGIGAALTAGTVDNGTPTDTAAAISGGDYGVAILNAGLVNNDGTITGDGAAGVYLGSGTVDNGTTADFTATIDSGPGTGVLVGDGIGVVNNFGTIAAPGAVSVDLESGGTVVNGTSADTGALITASFEGVLVGQPGSAFTGTIDNYGTITANGDDTINPVIAVFLENGGSVANLGSESQISGVDTGVLAEGGAGFVQNDGSIVASGTSGYGVDLEAGGTVTNGVAAGSLATITGGGTGDAVRIEGGSSASVDNEGTIAGFVGVDFLNAGVNEAAGTIVNDGVIRSTALVSPNAVEFGDGNELLVLGPHGSFGGAVLGGTGTGATTSLEYASGTSASLEWLSTDSGTVTDPAGTFTFSAFGTMAVDAGASLTLLTAASSTQTIKFNLGQTSATLALSTPAGAPASVQAVIEDFGLTGTIDLLGIANSLVTNFSYAGSTLDVLGAGNAVLAALDLPGPFSSTSFDHAPDTATTGTFITTGVAPCFTANTVISTTRGEVCVENLRVGDMALCANGGVRPIVWIGSRAVDIARHAAPEFVRPVLIRRGALGEGLPSRDLRLSPDHALYLDGVLVPARMLVNGGSIVRDADARHVRYYHVELDRHDVLLAEGVPSESYLDTGNRRDFDGAPVVTAHPLFSEGEGTERRAAGSCARLAVDEASVLPIWRRIAERGAQIGQPPHQPPTTRDPALRIVGGGQVLHHTIDRDGDIRVQLPRGIGVVAIVSRSAAPSDACPWLDDRRRMGVAVGAARFLIGRGAAHSVPLHALPDGAGWHALEEADGCPFRWTDGAARLAAPAGATELTIRVISVQNYPLDGPATVAAGAA